MSQTHQGSLWIPLCIPYSVVNKALEFFLSLASRNSSAIRMTEMMGWVGVR